MKTCMIKALSMKRNSFCNLRSKAYVKAHMFLPECNPILAIKLLSGKWAMVNRCTCSRILSDILAICLTCSFPFLRGSPDTTIYASPIVSTFTINKIFHNLELYALGLNKDVTLPSTLQVVDSSFLLLPLFVGFCAWS